MTHADIRLLVDRIADILGDQGDSARIEQLASLFFETLGENRADASDPSIPLAMRPESRRILVTAYGYDRPGILNNITRVLSDSGTNILDVSQKILQGYFTLIMLVDIHSLKGELTDLQRTLGEAGDALQVRVLVQHEDLFRTMHRP